MTGQHDGNGAPWEGEVRFRTAFAHASVGVAVTDAEGRFLGANPAYCRITGYDEDELLRLDFASLTHPDDRPENTDLIRRILDGQAPGFVTEKRYVRKDGGLVWVKASVSVERDGEGRPRRIIALTEDVTERKQAEDRLRASEERSRQLLDSTGEAIYGIDLGGRCTFCNPACVRALGYDRPDELLGRNMHELAHHTRPDGTPYPEHDCRIYRAFRQGDGSHADDEVLWRADGTPFPVEYRSYPVRKGGEVIGSVVTFTDITERKRAEATIAEQVRLAEYGRDVGRALTQGGTLEETLARIAESTVRHLDGAFARIWTANEAGDLLELRASAGMYTHTDGPHARIPVGRFKIGQIARDRKPHLTNAVIGDPLIPAQDWARAEGMVAFAGYPLVVDDRLAGVLAMFARQELSEATLRMMGSVADEVAVGIERKRGEERLHQQREWLRVTLASIGDAVIATDTDGRVTFLNGVAEALTGWRQHEAAGMDLGAVFRIVNERTRREVESPALRALRQGEVVGLANHTVLIARDGSERAIDDSAAPIRDEAGAVMGAVLIFRDVDDRRRTERSLEASEARKAAILESALDAIITIDHEGKVVEWNPAAERTFGHERAAVLGREMAGLIVPASLREAHRRGLAHFLRTGEGPVLGRRIEITAVRADGTEFPIELAITTIPAEGPPLFTAHVRDISDRRAAERRRDTRLAITEALATAPSLGAAAPRILQAVCEGLGWDLGALWTVDGEARALRCVGNWHSAPAGAGDFEEDCRSRTLPIGVGLPGRVWRSGGPAWLPDVTADDNFPRSASAAGAGLHGGFACPIRAGDEVLGVVEFFSGEVREPDPDLLEMMDTIGAQVGQFLERKRAEEALRASEERLRLALEAGLMGTWGWDIRANTVAWSPGLERIHGLEPGTFPGTFEAFQADIYPDDRERVLAAVARTVEHGADHHVEYRLALPDGRTRWVEARGQLFHDEAGRPERLVGVCMDISERKEAEGRLAEQTRIAESLNRIGVLLAAEHDLERLVQVVTDEATRLTDARFGAFFYNVHDDRGGSYTLYTISGVPREEFSRFPMPRATDLFGPTFRGEGPVRLDDATLDPRFGKNAPHRGMPEGHLPVRSYLAVPVASRTGEVLGGLFFGHPEPGVFSESDERLAVGIAAQAAVAIDNARLYREVQESERRFRQLADAVPQIVWAADGDGVTTYLNRRWYDYTGLTPERSLARGGWREAIHPDDLPALGRAASSSHAGGEFEAEYRLRDRTGAYRWHLGRAVPVLGDDGRVLRLYGSATDIDDRRRSEQTARFLADASAALAGLVDYEETLRRVAGMAVPAFADWCAVDMRVEGGRLRRVAVTHPDPEKLRLAHDMFEKYPPRYDDPHGIGKVLRTGEPELVEEITDAVLEAAAHDAEHLRLARALGLRSYLCVPLRPRGGMPGVLTFVTAESGRRYRPDDLRVAEDLARRATVAVENSELYRALREADRAKGELLATLRDSEERFRTMAESIPQLAWMARPDGHIYWYNKRWHDYTGTTPDEMEGWGWQKVHDPAVLPSVLERWKGSIASGEPFDMVFPLRGADGVFRPFLTRVAPVPGEDGRIAHWFGTNTEISDRLRIEEELRAAKDDAEAANRAKSQFLAVLSHELRTPLNPILLAASSMLERPADPEDVRPTLEMIRQNVNLQARLIDDLLDVMRIVRGKMPLHWEVADGHGLIRQSLQMCQSEIFGKELRLELDLGAREHYLNADPARFQQVIWNLVKNAVKFTPGGGAITIRTRNPEGDDGREPRLVIEVSDTGIGIERDVLPLIFDPFQQGESRITRKYGGLGLGLAICRGIVEAHGGELSAESPGKDRGTTFRIVLKTIPGPAPTDSEPDPTAPPDALAAPAPLRILAVEDEPATLRLMARLLRGLGHTVTTANSIASGYEAFAAGAFDLIVSDIGLPDGSGLELMRRVVALRGRIAAIALTGYGMEDDIQKSREAGFTAHMTKPIDFTKLEAMIAQVASSRS